MTFGEKVQKLRKEASLSQEELAYRLKVSRQAVSKWENNNGFPETEKLIKLAELFHTNLDYLLREEEQKESAEKEKTEEDTRAGDCFEQAFESYIAFYKRKKRKVAVGVFCMIASLAFLYTEVSELGLLLFLCSCTLAAALFVSASLKDNSGAEKYFRDTGAVLFINERIAREYDEYRKKYGSLVVFAVILLGISFLILPVLAGIISFSDENTEDFFVNACMFIGTAGTAVSAFILLYYGGVLKIYRRLLKK